MNKKQEIKSLILQKEGTNFKFRNIIYLLMILVFSIVLVTSFYIKYNFKDESLDEMLFYLINGVQNSDPNVLFTAVKSCIFKLLLLYLFIYFIFFNILINKKIYFNFKKYKTISKTKKNNIINIKKKLSIKTFQLYPIKIIEKHKFISLLILILVFALISFKNVDGFNFIKNQVVSSEFIEQNYNQIDSSKVIFKTKKNLIYIYLESFETTFFTKEQGGDWNYEVIPEMYKLLYDKNSICFSCNNKNGFGFQTLNTANWTTAAVVSNSTGLPFKIPIDGNSYHSSNFMNGSYALGDILKDNGYYNEVISASTTSFGGLKEFFTRHGNYNIVDIDSLKRNNLDISANDYSGWGFNDNYMFNIAKTRLNKISKKNKPFNLTLISIDTHFPDGYVGEYTIDKYNTQYENVYATASKLVYDFVKWVEKQDFFDDTVIVIVGDHPSMQAEYFKNNNQNKRLIYNVIINSDKKINNTNTRKYSSMDMLPTTLASMGAVIYKDKIGLGVNLYSNQKTLVEKYGIKELNKKLDLKSEFYNKRILGSDYNKMLKENNN